MLKDALKRILSDYAGAHSDKAAFTDKDGMAPFLRDQAKDEVQKVAGMIAQEFICKGSPGNGEWAPVPWLAVMHPEITESVQSGYFVVYLFADKANCVYLSLNQGTKKAKIPEGRKKKDILRERAQVM